MGSKHLVPLAPQLNIPLVDCHCHVPYKSPPEYATHTAEEQYQDFLKQNGQFFVTSSTDIESFIYMKNFTEIYTKCFLSAGFAPQTVTFTKKNAIQEKYQKWINIIFTNLENFISIGEIGLDFHHARTLDKRNQQIEYFTRIIQDTKELNKPYMLHVRNPNQNDIDGKHPDHPYNKKDAVNHLIIKILKKEQILPHRVMWHCFQGPENWGPELASQGYYLSVNSVAYRDKKMRKYLQNIPLEQLLTETDSYWLHPLKYRGYNIPSNVKYAIAVIAYLKNYSQEEIAHQIVLNAKKFFQFIS